MKNVAAIVLAAGRGTRMKSEIPKVLHRIHSKPVLKFVMEALDSAGVERKVLVLGYKDKEIKDTFLGIETVVQDKLLGSGDAVKRVKKVLSDFEGDILVLCGDTPLIHKETIENLIKRHRKEKASCTILTSSLAEPAGYGRILRGAGGKIVKVIEEEDTSIYEKAIDEINVGCYCFAKDSLFPYLEKIKINPGKGEYYFTDIIGLLSAGDKKIASVSCDEPAEATGINSRLDLAKASDYLKTKALEKFMLAGVTIIDTNTTFIDASARIGKDTLIRPNTVIGERVTIGENCEIGPFARLREGTAIEDNVEIGNFVELVRTKVSSGTKIKHMTYLGDAEIGKNVNIGAGSITANYDGKKKNKTVIGDGSFIGVGAIFIAPVKVGRGAVVGAGSVVTRGRDVPPGETVVGIPARILKKEKEK